MEKAEGDAVKVRRAAGWYFSYAYKVPEHKIDMYLLQNKYV
jgi:hypothetical protein